MKVLDVAAIAAASFRCGSPCRELMRPSADHYCLHCLTLVSPGQTECTGCDRSFAGAGRYGLASGPPPSQDFAFLFERPGAAPPAAEARAA